MEQPIIWNVSLIMGYLKQTISILKYSILKIIV
jgi:hypothetical protein